MKELYINTEWTFKEVVDNIKTLKLEYEKILASFSYFELKDKINFKHNTRNSFYSMNLKEWEIDKLWEYMNGYEELRVLIILACRRR